jgi:uncharacterized protein
MVYDPVSNPDLVLGLSIDGGGLRGIIPARILAEIEIRTGKHIAGLFEVIGGTSTGGIIAAALVYEDKKTASPKLTAHEILKMYLTNYEKFFPKK